MFRPPVLPLTEEIKNLSGLKRDESKFNDKKTVDGTICRLKNSYITVITREMRSAAEINGFRVLHSATLHAKICNTLNALDGHGIEIACFFNVRLYIVPCPVMRLSWWVVSETYNITSPVRIVSQYVVNLSFCPDTNVLRFSSVPDAQVSGHQGGKCNICYSKIQKLFRPRSYKTFFHAQLN